VIQNFPSGSSAWPLAEAQPNRGTAGSVLTVCCVAVRLPRSSKYPKGGYPIC
jgi:hypothetical protein